MNFWTGLVLGIIIGWLVEWIIDWLFWRRNAEEADLQMEERLSASVGASAADWEARLSDAENEYQIRLRAVEEEWRARLNLNEQQWQDQFSTLETDNTDLRARLTDAMALSTLAEAGSAPDQEAVEEGSPDEPVVAIDFAEDAAVIEADAKDVDYDLPAEAGSWPVDLPSAETGDLGQLDEMDSEFADIIERLHLAGIDSVGELAEADPAGLSVALGLAPDETEQWIERAAAALPRSSMPVTIDVEPSADVDVKQGAPSLIDIEAYEAYVEAEEVASPEPEIEVSRGSDLTIDIAGSRVDDLTRVHGIGPKYAAVLSAAGITSYAQLAAASPDELRSIINPGVMQKPNFGSWSMQAAALDGTEEVQAGDDLTLLDGIGPVYATKLRDRGILSFADLAAADEARLGEIIDAPAWRRIQYGDWISQAKLAATGDKIALREFQSRLFRRDDDNLTLIYGLGSRSATAFQAAGVDSFAAVAEATPQQLESILQEAGIRGGFDYEAWISEAELRAAGKRVPRTRTKSAQVAACPQDLSAVDGIGSVYEDRLYAAGIGSYWSLAELSDENLALIIDAHAGVDLPAIKSSAMKLAVDTNSQGRTWSGAQPDDFEMLAGIGEVYERRLYEAGICTYEALAALSLEQLAEICQAPPMQAPDYAAWVSTAAALAAGRSG